MSNFSLRNRLGCWLHERKDAELVLRAPRLAAALSRQWLDLQNRNERIAIEPATGGRICNWKDSSPLTVSRVFPEVGARLLKHCLKEWPISFEPVPSNTVTPNPDVSFVVSVRGTGRLPQFRVAIQSLLAQTDCSCEVIVVEQSAKQEFETIVPVPARYLHLPIDSPGVPFNRSWALNYGARNAGGRIIVSHDADMVVPTRFAAAIRDTIDRGYEAMRLARFIFYLSKEDSEQVWTHHHFNDVRQIDRIIQNNPTPVALTREAYMRIGGHDEAFYAWGGEDNEFMDRMRTLKTAEGTFLPVVHLWHPEAPNRSGDRNAGLLARCRSKPAAARVKELTARAWGTFIPSVDWTPAETDSPSPAATDSRACSAPRS